MLVLFCLVSILILPFKSRSRLEAENVALRHQVMVLRRQVGGRVHLTNLDRLFLVRLYHWFPSIRRVLAIVRPETVVRWHRAGFRCYWRWKSRSRGGRPQISVELRALIRRISIENPLWGAPRIHGELLKLGFEVAQSSVANYMVKRCGPPSQGWRTFLRNHAPDIAAIDLFVVPTIGFDLLYALVIVRLDRRQLVWINVYTASNGGMDCTPADRGISLGCGSAISDPRPGWHLRRCTQTSVRGNGHPDRPIARGSPWQNGFAERLIGSIRRECLDHVIVVGEAHLRRILRSYRRYYNEIRTHRFLDKDAPLRRPIQSVGTIRSHAILGGLHHRYARV